MERIGERLRRRREELGLTLEDVSEQTRFRPEVISAVEEGRSGVFPADAYLSAFLRAYARILELDPREIVREQKSEEERAVEAIRNIRVRPRRQKCFPRKLLYVIVPIALAAGVIFVVDRFVREREPRTASITGGQAVADSAEGETAGRGSARLDSALRDSTERAPAESTVTRMPDAAASGARGGGGSPPRDGGADEGTREDLSPSDEPGGVAPSDESGGEPGAERAKDMLGNLRLDFVSAVAMQADGTRGERHEHALKVGASPGGRSALQETAKAAQVLDPGRGAPGTALPGREAGSGAAEERREQAVGGAEPGGAARPTGPAEESADETRADGELRRGAEGPVEAPEVETPAGDGGQAGTAAGEAGTAQTGTERRTPVASPELERATGRLELVVTTSRSAYIYLGVGSDSLWGGYVKPDEVKTFSADSQFVIVRLTDKHYWTLVQNGDTVPLSSLPAQNVYDYPIPLPEDY